MEVACFVNKQKSMICRIWIPLLLNQEWVWTAVMRKKSPKMSATGKMIYGHHPISAMPVKRD